MPTEVETLTSEAFRAKIFDYSKLADWAFKGSRPTILNFYSATCGPCRKLRPIVNEIADHYNSRIAVFTIDTLESPEVVNLFEMKGVPALVFIPLDRKPLIYHGFMKAELFHQSISDIFGLSK